MRDRSGVFGGGDADERVEVPPCVLGHVADMDPLASGTPVSAVVQGVGDQACVTEPRRDVVVATGVLGVPVGEDDGTAGGRRERPRVRRPRVVDDPDAADTVETAFAVRHGHPRRLSGRPVRHRSRPDVGGLFLSDPLRKLIFVTVLAFDQTPESPAQDAFSGRRAAIPAGAARPLLPDDRLPSRRRGSRPGNLPKGVEVVQRVRRQILGTDVAVPHRHQHVLDGA